MVTFSNKKNSDTAIGESICIHSVDFIKFIYQIDTKE